MLQHLQLVLDWLASAQGSNLVRGLLALATALGLSGRVVALATALLSFWLAWRAGGAP